MPKTLALDAALLRLLFNATPIANLARDAIDPSLTLTVALHLADPTVSGNQSTWEIAYTGYARVAQPRGLPGWTVTDAGILSPTVPITFPQMTGGLGGSATYFSIGTGFGNFMMYVGPITPAIAVGIGTVPRLTGNMVSET